MVRLAVTKFLNTYPLIWDLEKSKYKDIELIKETPARCSSLLLKNKVEGGVVPISTFAYKQDLLILLNPCVASSNEVKTVKLYSNKEIDKIYEVIVDEDSRASVILLKILLSIKYRKHKLTFFKSNVSEIDSINDEFGYLLIGDKNFRLACDFKYQYDLASEWVEWVNLPFIFASWMLIDNKQNRKMESLIKSSYIKAKRDMDKVYEGASNYWNIPLEEVKSYFKENISFEVGLAGIKAVKLYFQMAYELKLLPKVGKINFIDV